MDSIGSFMISGCCGHDIADLMDFDVLFAKTSSDHVYVLTHPILEHSWPHASCSQFNELFFSSIQPLHNPLAFTTYLHQNYDWSSYLVTNVLFGCLSRVIPSPTDLPTSKPITLI